MRKRRHHQFANVRPSRSQNMARIRSTGTEAEIHFQQALHSLGVRYRLQMPGITGRPDLSNKRGGWVIFVDGCFWHGCPQHYHEPKTRRAYWVNKIKRNRARRRIVKRALIQQGWVVLEVWEHEIRRDAMRAARAVASETALCRDGRRKRRLTA